MPTRHLHLRSLAVLGATVLGLLLAGCVVISFSLPAGEVGHNGSTLAGSGALDDSNPDVAVYNGVRYVVFSGEATPGGDTELFIRGFDISGSPNITLTQLTFNSGEDREPRIVSGENGYLYIVWRYDFGTGNGVWWLRVNASTLAIANGPTLIATGASSGVGVSVADVQLAYAPGYTTTAVVWAASNPTSTVYYNRINDAGVLSSPAIVSQGTGCASASFRQYQPRMTRTYPSGTYTQIAWIGYQDVTGTNDGVYWRELDNTNGAFNSNCLEPSFSTGFFGGTESDLSISVNRDTTKSFVAWARYDGSTNYDVILRPISPANTVCNAMLLAHSDPAVIDYAPSIAAGHTISDWVHLAWEQQVPANAIVYDLIDASNCSATPVSVGSVITLSTPTGTLTDTNDVDAPYVSVMPGVSIATVNAAVGFTADHVQQLATSGRISQEQAAAVLADGVIASDEIQSLFTSVLQAPVQSNPPAQSGAGQTDDFDSRAGAHADFGSAPLDCAADPRNDRCLAQTRNLVTLTAGSQSVGAQATCGTGAADSVAVSFFDDTANQMYARVFQAGEYLYGSACYAGAFTDYGLYAQLARQDSGLADYRDHRVLVDTNGLATVVWSGADAGSPPFFPANDEVYLVTTRYPVMLPLVQR